jgi:hypothetical protein
MSRGVNWSRISSRELSTDRSFERAWAGAILTRRAGGWKEAPLQFGKPYYCRVSAGVTQHVWGDESKAVGAKSPTALLSE